MADRKNLYAFMSTLALAGCQNNQLSYQEFFEKLNPLDKVYLITETDGRPSSPPNPNKVPQKRTLTDSVLENYVDKNSLYAQSALRFAEDFQKYGFKESSLSIREYNPAMPHNTIGYPSFEPRPKNIVIARELDEKLLRDIREIHTLAKIWQIKDNKIEEIK